MTAKDLLFEIGTEELPTKAVKNLSESLSSLLKEGLLKQNLSFDDLTPFATPRRLGVMIKNLQIKQEDYTLEKRGPALKAAYDNNNNFTKATIGFASSCNTKPENLEIQETDKGSWLIYKQKIKGKKTEDLLEDIINDAIKKLPITKPMRWSNHDYTFVRPVHWALLLFGNKVINIQVLGVKTSNKTYGHRFLAPKAITIKTTSSYESVLLKNHVIANFYTRLDNIKQQILKLSQNLKLTPIFSEGLLEEVTSLVEWPVALIGEFDHKFLNVPQECLITSMVNNQKYFALINNKKELQPYFIFISNIKSKNKKQVIQGNQRVLSARLSDAEFFFTNDKKTTLADRTQKLRHIIYQQKLGSLYDKTKRIENVTKLIADNLNKDSFFNINIQAVTRAALLCKTDLVSEMVYEFPELQGIMGKYYALHDGETSLVANCLEQYYLPKQAGDNIPASTEACILAIADKLDTIVGIFAIGQKPTGDKDPFGLRRAALGLLRILIEHKLPLDLKDLINYSINSYQINSNSNIITADKLNPNLIVNNCLDFCFERLKNYYLDQNISINLYYAIINSKTTCPYDFSKRIYAVNNFLNLPQANQLIAANKRVKNILSKQSLNDLPTQINAFILKEDAEKNLNLLLTSKNTELLPLFNNKDYDEILKNLAELQSPIDLFFDKVMVMCDDQELKNNRLLLLKNIQSLFNKVADISELQQ